MRKQLSLKAAAQAGFTLIELIIVIVIIGILAAVAIPKYVQLTDDANIGVANGIAGSVASAAATNWAACQGSLASCVATVTTCGTALGLLESNPGGTMKTAADTTGCIVVYGGQESAPFNPKLN